MAQDAPGAYSPELKVVVASPASGSASVLAVPPATSWTGTVGIGAPGSRSPKSSDLTSWISGQNARVGLTSLKTPWHIVIAYDQFDEDGDNVHSGTYEELWAGSKKFRVSYKADDLNQVDYATAQGLYRSGDQQWPNSTQEQISKEVLNPFFEMVDLERPQLHETSEKFGDHILECAVIEKGIGGISNPLQYCFSSKMKELRYKRGSGWYQTTYNDIASFSGISVAKSIDVYNGGKPYLRLRVQQLELAPEVTDTEFIPPADAKKLGGQTVAGVRPTVLRPSFPTWPDSLRQQQFSVTVEILIGKDGHVASAHAISGPQSAYKSAEETARKWVYKPYLVLGEPTEVTTKIILNNN
jgi:Gram-negative bacterial TonB protein C-terminal